MKILMAASECVPFIKVGGLADVVGTLPGFLKKKKHDVRVFIPKYGQIDEKKFALKPLAQRLLIPVGKRIETATIKEGKLNGGVTVYFIENDGYFNRPDVYRTDEGDYTDNRERFIFFSRAVIEAAKALNFRPDIIHCHDWQTAIIPALLKTSYSLDAFYNSCATVYTIHNIAYQGMFDADTLTVAGLPVADFTWDKLEYYGKFNFMKAGIVYADIISTVSPTYAREILLTEQGRGMEGTLRSKQDRLAGILNGIDYNEWNPGSDPFLAGNFSKDNTTGKALCKQNLQKEARLPQEPGTMLIGSVSRLDPQKGYDVLAEAIEELLSKNNIQLVILGNGDRDIHDLLSSFSMEYPDKISFNSGFNNTLAHKIYAGSDAFLMPSRFEPCGLGQMIALAYGTVPIVHRTGGLSDSITEFDSKTCKGNGFSYLNNTPAELAIAVNRALKIYKTRAKWKKLAANTFASDFSWEAPVEEYIRLYKKAINLHSISKV